MFTGIIEGLGRLQARQPRGGDLRFTFATGSLPFEAVQQAIASYLEEASYRRAVAQYIAILAGQAGVSGVAIAGAEGAMVQ